jgi:Predicted glycosyltransferases
MQGSINTGENILVSAIIVTHNRLPLLKRAVKSVENQTYDNIELIVVDDASDDGTNIYGDELIKRGYKYLYIDKEHSKGGNHARNVGIKNSTGEYIALLDDDDYWKSYKTEKQVNYLNEHPEYGMVYSGLDFDYQNKLYNFSVYPNEIFSGDIVKNKTFWGPFCSTITMMIRRNVLDEVGLFDENLTCWQEYELALRIIQVTKVGIIKETLSVANRKISAKRATNEFNKWADSVRYIENKHKRLYSQLDEKGIQEHKELVYREAAHRASISLGKRHMKQYYRKAYAIRRKPEYLIRSIFGLSKNTTLILESIIRHMIVLRNFKRAV